MRVIVGDPYYLLFQSIPTTSLTLLIFSTMCSSSLPSAFNVRFPVIKQFIYEGKTFPGYACSSKVLENCRQFEIHDDDICLVSYPRSGSRWTAEILSWINHDGDEQKVQARDNISRCPLLEFSGKENEKPSIPKSVNEQRLFATHLNTDMAPHELDKKGRIVCITRNPKDVVVSMFHFYRNHTVLGPYEGTWEEFLQGFMRGEVVFGSYFDWMKSWWKVRDKRKMLLITYEEMKREPVLCIKKISKFLDKDLTESITQMIAKKTSFEEMQGNPNTNFTRHPIYKANFRNDAEFIRKGEVGDWENYFTVVQNEEFDKLANEELKGLDIHFEYE